jgi:oxalate decarboxylase/phosphoglucose isomerase-like protein (cupin superfamily)
MTISPELRFTLLNDHGDVRGASFTAGTAWLEFLGRLEDVHITTLLPGYSRGNHYHANKKEVLIVLFEDRWQLSWDNGEATEVTAQHFSGTGAVLIEVDPLSSHAITNTGHVPLWILGLSNAAWDASDPDAHPRQVVPQL